MTDKAKLIDLYLSGLSIKQVAAELKIGKSYVGEIVKAANISRPAPPRPSKKGF